MVWCWYLSRLSHISWNLLSSLSPLSCSTACSLLQCSSSSAPPPVLLLRCSSSSAPPPGSWGVEDFHNVHPLPFGGGAVEVCAGAWLRLTAWVSSATASTASAAWPALAGGGPEGWGNTTAAWALVAKRKGHSPHCLMHEVRPLPGRGSGLSPLCTYPSRGLLKILT